MKKRKIIQFKNSIECGILSRVAECRLSEFYYPFFGNVKEKTKQFDIFEKLFINVSFN